MKVSNKYTVDNLHQIKDTTLWYNLDISQIVSFCLQAMFVVFVNSKQDIVECFNVNRLREDN